MVDRFVLAAAIDTHKAPRQMVVDRCGGTRRHDEREQAQRSILGAIESVLARCRRPSGSFSSGRAQSSGSHPSAARSSANAGRSAARRSSSERIVSLTRCISSMSARITGVSTRNPNPFTSVIVAHVAHQAPRVPLDRADTFSGRAEYTLRRFERTSQRDRQVGPCRARSELRRGSRYLRTPRSSAMLSPAFTACCRTSSAPWPSF